MLVVVALGGNALLRRGEPMTIANQRQNVVRAMTALAPLIAAGHRLVITHGNGPQVGLLALQAASGPPEGQAPLDVLDAESEGMVGYLIEQELRNVLPSGRQVATLLTQVEVDPSDPAFGRPTKPIGPVYEEAFARGLAAERGWAMAKDGDRWRRVVPSPQPRQILGSSVVRLLVTGNVIVVCAGGGGIPVVAGVMGGYQGVEAVVDKDLTSALLARELGADHLIMLTDVAGVFLDWGDRPDRLVASAAPGMLDPSRFAVGSMGPKVEAANSFADATGNPSSIGRLEDAAAILAGRAGTTITRSISAIGLRK